MKPRLKPSSPGLFELSQFHTAFFYFLFSDSFHQHVIILFWDDVKNCIIESDSWPIIYVEPFLVESPYLCFYLCLIFEPLPIFSQSTDCVSCPSPLDNYWKYLVFKSHWFNHLWRAFFCKRSSWLCLVLLCSAIKILFSSLPSSSNSLSSSLASNSWIRR